MFDLFKGFDQDPEARHVAEITQKMADYVIETDTDTSMMPTDTGMMPGGAYVIHK